MNQEEMKQGLIASLEKVINDYIDAHPELDEGVLEKGIEMAIQKLSKTIEMDMRKMGKYN